MKVAEGSTLLGRSVAVRGEIVGSEDLFVDGAIEGTITLTESRLTLGANAAVRGELHVHDAVIMGRLAGDMVATGRVELRESGSVLGSVSAARLSIEDTATMRGKVLLTGRE